MKNYNTSTSNFKIGDLVKPNAKAFNRNKEFSSDRRFIITGLCENLLSPEKEIWYRLAIYEAKQATFQLPESELDLVKSFEWTF